MTGEHQMSQSTYDRRKVLGAGLVVGTIGTTLGIRAVLAHEGGDHESTPEASPEATPGATPGATPSASPAAAATEEVTVEMVDIDFNPNEFSIPADTDVMIISPNNGQLQHDFHIEDTDYATELADPGETVSVSVNLAVGEYVYYCSVPGHREAGMEGTLTVE
jgi:uncharacterized cupredoxin-like copper-binding protein